MLWAISYLFCFLKVRFEVSLSYFMVKKRQVNPDATLLRALLIHSCL